MGKARRKDKDVTSSVHSQEESKQYLEATMLESSAPDYKLREVVDLPQGLDYNEWLASHTLAFFDHINLVYGTISEFCTMSGCPDMFGPGNRHYLWIDERGKRCKLPAPQYIDYVMTYTQKTVNDESIFPTKFDKDFPSSFESAVRKIMRLLFHVMAHLYHSHFNEILLLNLHPHLNCIFAHFVLFNNRFKLVEDKEVEALADLAIALKLFPPLNTSEIASRETPLATPEPAGPSTAFNMNAEEPAETSSENDKVITTQCRSISPFVDNNNSGFKNQPVSRYYNKENTTFSILPSQDEVPLRLKCENKASDATNCSLANKLGEAMSYCRNNLPNRRCTSASAVLLSCSSEPSINTAFPETRRSNSSGTSNTSAYIHHSTARGSVCRMDTTNLFASTSVTTGSSALKYQ